MKVESVSEKRSTIDRDNLLEIKVNIKGVELNENKYIRVKEYTKVVDDTGLNIFQKKGMFLKADEFQSNGGMNLTFETPSRAATTIESINGIMEYFTPSEQNGGKTIIKKPLSKINSKIIEDKDSGVTIYFSDKEAIAKYNEKYKNDLAKTIDSLATENEIEAAIMEKSTELSNSIQGLFAGLSSLTSREYGFYFKVNDVNENLVEINVYNEKGTLMTSGYSKYGDIIQKDFREEPNENWTIEILIKTKKAVNEFAFSLKSINLP